jgi:hypothetical protein
VRRIAAVAIITFAVVTMGCRKTGEGEYEVERPVVGTTTDTVLTPSVDVGTDTATIKVPDVDVTMPDERRQRNP